MLKPGVYLDTNIISAYWYEGSDVMSLARRIHTRDRLAGVDSPGPPRTNDSEVNMTDPIVDEVRGVREELIQRYGGLEGYLRHCEEQDRRRTSHRSNKARGRQRRQTSRSRRSRSKP